MKPYLTHEYPLRFAHRGSRVLWPENTMVAFQGAVDLGYKYIETDVHVSRDDKVVVFHDDSLERLTDGVGKVVDRDWDYLRRLDAAFHFESDEGVSLRGTGAAVPLLEEVVTTFPDQMFNVDLKQRGIAQRVADEARRLGIQDRVLIGSFYDLRIRRFRKMLPAVATSAGPAEVARALVAQRPGGEADAFQVPERVGALRLVTQRFIDAVHLAGKQIHVWTVDEPSDMRRLLDLGVDGIITDRPDLLNEVVFGPH